MMLFLNISTDNIVIEINNEKISLSRNNIEETIWPKLVQLYREYKFTDIFVLNWPGWFTNLRVWTLAINLLNSLENWAFNSYSISKIDFFNYFVKKWILPNKWIIYIWQKKNVRLYDFDKWDYTTIKKDEIDYSDNLFFDLVYEEWYFEKWIIDINAKWEKIIMTYNGNKYETSISELELTPEKLVDAKYFIKPIMWKQWQ